MTSEYDETVAIAQHALTRARDTSISLELDDVVVDYPGAAAIILRCRVRHPVDGLSECVIVKRSMSETQHLFREWANLEFLNSVSQISALVPAVFGGDAENEILVMEDVGCSRTLLGNIVEGGDPVEAEAGLLAFQRTLGRLHASTVGHEDDWSGFRVRRNEHTTSRHVINRTDEMLSALPEMFRGEGMQVSPALLDEVTAMRQEIANPGPFLAYTHGDAAIGNVFFSHQHGTRLIDFETGAYRHALLDGCYARMRYLVSVWARRMPLPLQRRLLGAYREKLVEGCPEAADDRLFSHGLLASSTFWLAAILQHLPSVAEQDRKFGRSTYRQRIVAALDHFVQLSQDLERSGPIAVACADLRHRLRTRWTENECTMRLCNAYQANESW